MLGVWRISFLSIFGFSLSFSPLFPPTPLPGLTRPPRGWADLAGVSAQRLDPVRWSRLRREPSVEELSQGRLGGAGVKDPPADAGDGFDP